jgi:hypothetical protein
MVRALIAAMAVVGTLAVAAPLAANAEPGAGLYAPFPQGGSDRARAFFGDRIPTSVSADALRDGIVLPAGRHLSGARVDPAPSHRAGQGGGDPDGSGGWRVGAALAAGAAAGLVAFVLRRRPSEAH